MGKYRERVSISIYNKVFQPFWRGTIASMEEDTFFITHNPDASYFEVYGAVFNPTYVALERVINEGISR